ncbi:hypothetical protein [Legionella fallonii]|uniref:Uncharacterized protein n=1 Tax=Legionella fallonii LLAP-10 TaxID=1212491 RepID=A0A098G0T6_9GAMM|nr:hypothetical protein [Legionella fallonii]CEG56127.1 protein of unknown function [Legionella fallonii LLAP-10]
MTFKEWCFRKFGITRITEGKVVNYKLLPIATHPFLSNYHQLLVASYGAIPLNNQGRFIGYILPQATCHAVAHYLRLPSYGMKLNEEEYNFQAPVLVKVTDTQKADIFSRFKSYRPIEEFDPLSKEYCIRLDSQVLDALYHDYYLEQTPKKSIKQLKSELDTFKLMQQRIISNKLSGYLDKAHILSLDYSNSKQVNCAIYEASSAYGMSLKIFAEYHKEALSNQQYMTLMHATEILASYDKNNYLQQGLKSDSNFVDYISCRLPGDRSKHDGSLKLISELPNQQLISHLITENAHDLLHGRKYVSLGKNKIFTMRRFLPDSSMRSETNEIILQTGGMINHSSMVRLIKVGMLKNGTQAPQGMRPDYFNYFKVETNLGAGCHDAEWRYKSCTGTYITQLQPTINHNGTIIHSPVSPIQNPDEYQHQMEHTLTELIQTERELRFYRQPQSGPNGEGASPPHSAEAHEWLRLNAKIDELNGRPVLGCVDFLSINVDGDEIPMRVHNQKGYMQEGGSCPIFSIKQLVTSITGKELCSLHSQFLQTHNGTQHLNIIEQQITTLDNQIKQITKKQVQHYLDSINAYILVLQNPDFLSQNKNLPSFYLAADFVESVKDFPDLHRTCVKATSRLFEQFTVIMAHGVRNTKQSSFVYDRCYDAYMGLPTEFRNTAQDLLNEMRDLSEHNSRLYQILDSDNYTQEEHNFWSQALKSSKVRVSPAIIHDLKTIRTFCNNKLQLAEQNNFGEDYKTSIKEFYKKVIPIRLSDLSHQDQAQQMKDVAQTEFSHRHSTLRLLADIITMIGTLFGMGIARVLTGHSFFWSTAATTREAEFTRMVQPGTPSDTFLSPILVTG